MFIYRVAKYQNNTGVSAPADRHEIKNIISFLTRHNEPINDDKKTLTSTLRFTRSVYVLLMTSN